MKQFKVKVFEWLFLYEKLVDTCLHLYKLKYSFYVRYNLPYSIENIWIKMNWTFTSCSILLIFT